MNALKRLVAAPAALLALALPVSAGAVLHLGEHGLGPIVATTRFDQEAIQRLLPGYLVKREKRSTEGESYNVLIVTRQGRTLATINPAAGEKSVFSIRVTGPHVVNQLGPGIGATYASIYGQTLDRACRPGEEELSGKVICPHPNSRRVAYVLGGRSGGPDGSLPRLERLKTFVVEEIVWRP